MDTNCLPLQEGCGDELNFNFSQYKPNSPKEAVAEEKAKMQMVMAILGIILKW